MKRWAVILAGGNGTRLQSLTRKLFGPSGASPSEEGRPKQFCTLFGDDTLLGHTRARIASVVAPERTTYLVVKAHAPYYTLQLADIPADRILAQPVNCGTTAAVAYAVARIAAMHSHTDAGEMLVGFFPADHYFADEDAFARALDRAYRLADLHTNQILLLGAQPEHPEVEYGWIEPGSALSRMDMEPGRVSGAPVFRVNRFWEKPSLEVARGLLDRGCLWNTFIMIGRVRTFIDAMRESVPDVFRAFQPMLDGSMQYAGWSQSAEDFAGQVYSSLASGDFSKQVLSRLPERLAVLPLDNSGWSDLGTPERLIETLSRFGVAPLTAV